MRRHLKRGLILMILSFFILLGSETYSQELENSSSEVERQLAIALAKAKEPLHQFELNYLENLKKAQKEAQVLAVQKERSDYNEPGDRDFAKFPGLQRLRGIYEDNYPGLQNEVSLQISEVYRRFLPMLEAEIRELTRNGNLDMALALSRRKDEITLEMARLEKELSTEVNPEEGNEKVVWEFKTASGVEKMREMEVNSTEEGFELKGERTPWVEARKTMRPPFSIRAKVATDSTNIRFYYADRTFLVFNWEMNTSELRFNDPATGRKNGFPGVGEVEVGVFHDIEIDILDRKIEVKVNGETRAELSGDYEDLSGRVGIGPAAASTVTVKEMTLVELD